MSRFDGGGRRAGDGVAVGNYAVGAGDFGALAAVEVEAHVEVLLPVGPEINFARAALRDAVYAAAVCLRVVPARKLVVGLCRVAQYNGSGYVVYGIVAVRGALRAVVGDGVGNGVPPGVEGGVMRYEVGGEVPGGVGEIFAVVPSGQVVALSLRRRRWRGGGMAVVHGLRFNAAAAAVQVEAHRVAVDIPPRGEGDVLRYPVEVERPAVRLVEGSIFVPAAKVVPHAIGVGGRGYGIAVGYPLGGEEDAGGGLERHGKGVDNPQGVEVEVAGLHVNGTVGVQGTRAVGLGVPAGEGVACPRGGGQRAIWRSTHRRVVGNLFGGGAYRHACPVEYEQVLVRRPPGVEVNAAGVALRNEEHGGG